MAVIQVDSEEVGRAINAILKYIALNCILFPGISCDPQ